MTARHWQGLVDERTDDHDGVTLTGTLSGAGRSWAGPFRGLGEDDLEYFVKSLATCPAGKGASLASELIVSRLGALIGAPVCATRLIWIPDLLDGISVGPGVTLGAGWAFGSVAITRAAERRDSLSFRTRNDNRRRHVGAYALHDWCWGGLDRQWLHDLDQDRAIFSHDHGRYFPPAPAKPWDPESLLYALDTPHELQDPTENLLPAAVEEIATRLEEVRIAEIRDVLNLVPASWPVSDTDLEALGEFLEYRAKPVAERLRKLTSLDGDLQ